jgi:hypothetical protein
MQVAEKLDWKGLKPHFQFTKSDTHNVTPLQFSSCGQSITEHPPTENISFLAYFKL